MPSNLDNRLTPCERMAEIRRLVRDSAAAANDAERAESIADRIKVWRPDEIEDLWRVHNELVGDLLEHLWRAEASGELGECEGRISVGNDREGNSGQSSHRAFPPGWWIGIAALIGAVLWAAAGLFILLLFEVGPW